MRLLLLIISIAIIANTGCTPEKRLQSLLKRYPHLVTKIDTTYTDTIITQHVRLDTLITAKINDTIYFERDRLTVQIIRTVDTLRISANCKSDTIVKTLTVPKYEIKQVAKPCNYMLYILIGFVSALLVVILLKR